MRNWKRGKNLQMTLCPGKNSTVNSWQARLKNDPYLLFNIILAGAIVLIMVYSVVFSPLKDNYPVVCIHQKITGQPCISCGLSHSFSLILRGRIDEAKQWNRYGLRVFLFFAVQLLLRVIFSIIYLKRTVTGGRLIMFDAAVSVLIFLVGFMPFIVSIFRSLF